MVKKIVRIFAEIVIILLGIIYQMPIYIIAVNSFKTKDEVKANILSFPKRFTLEYYGDVIKRLEFANAFKNSVIVTFVSVIFIVLLASCSAWMLVRCKGKISRIIFLSFAATMLIPIQTLVMPLLQVLGFFRDYTHITLIDNLGGLIVCYVGFGMSMAIFLYHGFITGFDIAYEESAIVDGANPYQIFWRIVFPMIRPISMTVVVLDVIWIWNDYLLPSLILFSKDNRTIPLATQTFFGQYTIQWNVNMAGLTLTVIPVIIFYFFAQKYIIRSIAAQAVK